MASALLQSDVTCQKQSLNTAYQTESYPSHQTEDGRFVKSIQNVLDLLVDGKYI